MNGYSAKTRWLLAVGLGVIGAGMLLLSYIKRENQWLSGTLVEFGATIFLAIPLLIITMVIQEDIRRNRRISDAAIEAVRKEVEDLESRYVATAKEVDRQLLARTEGKFQRESDAFAALLSNPSREDFRHALTVACNLKITGKRGPRVELRGSGYLLRFALEGEERIHLVLEHLGGEEWRSWEWPETKSFPDMLEEITDSLIESHQPPGRYGLESARAIEDLEYLLQVGLKARYENADNTLQAIVHIEERSVAVTDYGVVQLNHPDYVVPNVELIGNPPRMNWYRHIEEKSWVDKQNFFVGLDIAKDLTQLGQLGNVVDS